MSKRSDGRASNGGARPGAGAKPQTATLRLGQRLAMHQRTPDGFAPIVAGTITEIRRGVPRIVVIVMEDGTEYRLMI